MLRGVECKNIKILYIEIFKKKLQGFSLIPRPLKTKSVRTEPTQVSIKYNENNDSV